MPGERDQEVAAAAIDAVGLGPLRQRSVAILSGGERQHALGARALAQQPRLLLMDEPTTHLDLAQVNGRQVVLWTQPHPGQE